MPYPTGTVQVELDPNGVPMYDIKEGVALSLIHIFSLEGLRGFPFIVVSFFSVGVL